jgi:anti-sigma B factor antagonist
MMTPTCRLEYIHEGPTTTLRLVGELDISNTQDLRDCFTALAKAGQERIIVDLSELDFIDSMGIGALVGGLKRFRSAGGEFVLRDPSSRVLKVIELTGLDQVFTII